MGGYEICFVKMVMLTLQEKIPSVEVSGDIILGTFGFNADQLYHDTAMLCVLCTVFLVATFLLLKFRRSP